MEIKNYSLIKEEIAYLLSTALYGSPWLEVDNSTEEYKQAKGDTIEEKLADMLGVLETNTVRYYFKKYGIEKNHAKMKEKYNYPKKGRINL